MSFWKEVQRRNVVKVGIAYAIVAWLIIHPVDIIFPTLHLPEWTTTFVTALFIIAFPFVLIFSWVYEITPKGLKKTKEVPLSKSITHLTGHRLNYIIIGLLVVALGYFVFDKYFISPSTVETKRTPVVSNEEKTIKTIAVLPFVNLSPEKDQEYFVDGLSEELLNTLTQVPDLLVTARTSSFSFKGSNKTIQEIANVLGVENILEGSVRKVGNTLRISAQLIRTKDGFHLWSKNYDRELKDILVIQEEIATVVASELKATLGVGKSLKQLGGTDNEKAYELYLIGKGQSFAIDLVVLKGALESIDTAIALDPNFALAWELKSEIHNSLAGTGPVERAASEQELSLQAAQKSIDLEPNLMEAYAALGSVRSTKGELFEAGLAYQKAAELTTGPLWSIPSYLPHLTSVGYFKRALELMESAWKSDPLNQEIRFMEIEIFGYLGDIEKAEERYKQAMSYYRNDCFICNLMITGARLGSGHAVSSNDIVDSNPVHDAAKKHIDTPKEGIAELHRFYTDDDYQNNPSLHTIIMWAAYFGDPEFAMDVIEKLGTIDAKLYLYPVMKQVRQLPRFKKLVKKIGLVDYWNKFGWPDICHQLDNGDFVCD